jgi:hypothetical protein
MSGTISLLPSYALWESKERFLPHFKTRYSVDYPEVLISYAFLDTCLSTMDPEVKAIFCVIPNIYN